MESEQPVDRMANAELRKGRVIRISYKRATYVVCTVNLVLAVCLMYSILSPLHLKSDTPHVMAVVAINGRRPSSQRTTREELLRLRSSDKLRRDMVPIHLIQEVKVLQAETEEEITRTKKLSSVRQKKSIEVSQRLAEVRRGNTQANQQGLQKWRKKKLRDATRFEAAQRGR